MTQKRITRSSRPTDACRVVLGFAFGAAMTLMVAATAAMAQTGGGATIVGTVKDSSGSVVAQAKVTVVNTETAFVAETSTTAEVGYYVPYLNPGNYRVTVTAPGFKEFVPVDQAKVDNWSMGNRFPTAAQTPYFNISAFAYAAPYTVGSLGARVLQAPAILWLQCFATKSWKFADNRLKVSLRLDGYNLPWKNPNLAAPNTTYNLNNTSAWARFTGVLGDFSNFGTGQANVQASIRAEF